MKTCPNCQHQNSDTDFCIHCGTPLTSPDPQEPEQQEPPQQEPEVQVVIPICDHTSEFQEKDISENKVFAMLCYLTGLFGVLIATVAAQKSDYTMFHVRQALKFVVVEALMAIVSTLLCWTVVVPVLCAVAYVVLWIIKIITVFQIGSGKAVEPAIIRDVKFLK